MRLLCLLSIAAAAYGQTGLIGRWRTLETSKGAVGALYEFQDGGAMTFSPSAVVELKYRIEGTDLILPPTAVNGPELHQAMKWTNENTLVLTVPGGTQTLNRVGKAPDAKNPIVGEWSAPREKLTGTYVFNPDGSGLFLLPFVAQKGQYSVQDGNIHLQIMTAKPVDGPFHVDGDVLTIPGPGGVGEAKFKRY